MTAILLTRGRRIVFALALIDLLFVSFGLVALGLVYEGSGGARVLPSGHLALLAGFVPFQLAALHAFGLQEPTETFQVWRYGGRLAIATWASLEESDAYREEVDLLDRVAGTAAGDAVRAPFVLGDTDNLKRLFEEAGAESVNIAGYTGTGRFPNIRIMVDADLRGWLPVMGVLLDSADAPAGQLPYTDGAAIDAMAFDQVFPYLTTPSPPIPASAHFSFRAPSAPAPPL